MDSSIAIISVSFAVGVFLMYIILKLLVNKPRQSQDDYERLKLQLQDIFTSKTVVENTLSAALVEKQELQRQVTELQTELNIAAVESARLQVELKHNSESLALQKQQLEHIGEKFEAQFRVLADNILEEKTKKFGEQQDSQLKNLLEPLRQNISHFKQEFETRYSDESKERISLKEQIRHMMDLNKTLSDQANNLTTALRGQVKQQGNWGEMILERILEHAGLQKNIQYFAQYHTQNIEGQTIQPDVLVKYPDDRAIVIDAKVSLVHYERYCAALNEVEQRDCLRGMIQSLKAHIDGLSAKSYQDITNALDFVMMFIPVEAAYIVAMQGDTTLWQYAYNKRVLLLSPTNLITAMKLVNDMWQRDAVNKDAHKIAEKAGRLYDKLVGFVDNFERVGQQLEKAQGVYNDAFKQLSKGRGNLIAQAEQMKPYKAATNKSLPTSLVEESLVEDRQII
ncbi:MAG: DNA recombination protein RmuC [Sphingobacteriales bacterium]|nr:MAG: DNA recombination protein RmuC [Sphingobacteriales bacterium]